jgi:hypothetical protein
MAANLSFSPLEMSDLLVMMDAHEQAAVGERRQALLAARVRNVHE